MDKTFAIKVCKQLLKEFWLPLIVAVSWTSYAAWPMTHSWAVVVGVFSASFFFVSFLAGQVNRVAKQIRVSSGLDTLEHGVSKLLSQLEKQTNDLVGYATGGESICRLVTSAIVRSRVFEIHLTNPGPYPVYDLHASLTDMDEPIEVGQTWTRHVQTRERLDPGRYWGPIYGFDMQSKPGLRLNLDVIQRNGFTSYHVLIVWTGESPQIARRERRPWQAGSEWEYTIPNDFPGLQQANPAALFE